MNPRNKAKKTILAIAAHPDDEVLGCGGTLARSYREGHTVYIAILGEGITSRYPQREQADSSLLTTLRADCHKVADLLGATELFQYALPDNRFDSVPLLDIIKIVEELKERLRPDVIYTHHGGDLNIDHVVLHRAVLTATRPIRGESVKEILTFEIPSSTEWAFQQFSPAFRPNVFVDILDTLVKKIQGMLLYDSEARPFPHPRSVETLTAIAKKWGSMVGCQAAEAFELVRSIR
ncbi:MAG: PIG-L family deacetylase [Candidatus Omnitrophota bacterium]|jgi:LmbE family N-acetylglucosaminyl deacetylase|nr:MAG: PIG-L family deacetylase [Candidatus Omnitrophota bacterium]